MIHKIPQGDEGNGSINEKRTHGTCRTFRFYWEPEY